MTTKANARIAGFTLLFYIAVAAAPVASQLRPLTGFLSNLSAIVLGVTLWALTRDQDRDLAVLAMACRVAEGVSVDSFVRGALFFSVGSLLFSWLLLRGRKIPDVLAWLGVIASVILVLALPLQMIGALTGTITKLIWIPMALFEVPLGLWLMIKGVNPAPAP